MQNLDKIIKNILILFWLGLCCTTLKAEVVITEFFILQADSTHAPQYVELYNNSDSLIDLTDWSITTLAGVADTVINSFALNIEHDAVFLGSDTSGNAEVISRASEFITTLDTQIVYNTDSENELV